MYSYEEHNESECYYERSSLLDQPRDLDKRSNEESSKLQSTAEKQASKRKRKRLARDMVANERASNRLHASTEAGGLLRTFAKESDDIVDILKAAF